MIHLLYHTNLYAMHNLIENSIVLLRIEITKI